MQLRALANAAKPTAFDMNSDAAFPSNRLRPYPLKWESLADAQSASISVTFLMSLITSQHRPTLCSIAAGI